jgi:hypothetical protein
MAMTESFSISAPEKGRDVDVGVLDLLPRPRKPDQAPNRPTRRDAVRQPRDDPRADIPGEGESITVRVVHAMDGTAVPNARVRLGTVGAHGVLIIPAPGEDPKSGNTPTRELKTDEKGQFTFRRPIGEDRLILVVEHELGQAVEDSRNLNAGDAINLGPGSRLEGTVYKEGRLSVGEPVILQSRSQTVYIDYATKTGPDGRFVFERVLPGSATLYLGCESDRRKFRTLQCLSLPPGKTVRVDQPGPGYRVTFELPEPDSNEVDWRKVNDVILATAGKGLSGGSWRYRLTKIAERRFTVDSVEPGEYELWGMVDNRFQTFTAEFTVSDENTAREIDLGTLQLIPQPENTDPRTGSRRLPGRPQGRLRNQQ